MRVTNIKRCGVILLVLLLGACGLWDSRPMGLGSPEALYQRGYEDYHKGRYKEAIEAFQRVQEEYPLSKLALMAELGVADSYFSDEQYAEAEMGYDDFMNLHPTNENLPYVMYQIGMCHYNQMSNIDRDQTETVRAGESFERLVARFPSSKFAFMGEKRLRECRKRLGEHELYVGQFYFRLKKYKAALRRFETVEREYANLGMDYQIRYFIEETKRRIVEEKTNQENE